MIVVERRSNEYAIADLAMFQTTNVAPMPDTGSRLYRAGPLS